ncbi:MAG: UDP-2,3-diacylglucosamine diphosphatase LpxI, partial [Sedimentisphaerales bacterium]|nr:UDP-2,3-diacylglucosamine diphosphatase LpxI [Sedimentisphaerales bacterium]
MNAEDAQIKPVLGLIAGQGRLPFLVADGARAAGFRVYCAALRDQVDPALRDHVDGFSWVPIARPGRWIRLLRRRGVRETIMVGRVAKRRIYTPWRILQYLPDWRAFRIWYGRLRRRDKRNDTLLAALADELETGGIVLVDSVQYCREHLARDGVMTRRRPGAAVLADIEFGWDIVKKMGELDIGQAIAVKEREVIAVEALEGTDAMIERAGRLCAAGGWTLIKTAKPNQDMRFDVPTIGIETIENLKKHRAVCVAVEAEKTLILDLPRVIERADRCKIAIVGHRR